jgi:hypothetical protein
MGRMDGHIARVGEIRNAYRIIVGNLKWAKRLGHLGVGGRIILKEILKK